jgi:peptidoglycan/LPS O-acetylase OafA/YrhL
MDMNLNKEVLTMTQPGSGTPVRRRDLDGLRGVAVLLVVFFHYVCHSGYFRHLGPRPIALFLDSLWSGVDIFFVLSGFLIGGIIFDHGSSDNFFRVFYSRRALRILPVAFFAIAFSFLVIPIFNSAVVPQSQVPALAYLLFINNFWTARGLTPYAPLRPLWSLAIEEQFYLIAPALMSYIGSRPRTVLLAGMTLVSPLLRMHGWALSPWDFTFFRFDGFAAGMLVAVMLRNPRFWEFADRSRMLINYAVLGLLIATLLFSISPKYTPHQRIAIGV